MLKITMMNYKLLTKNMSGKRSDYFNKNLYIQHVFELNLLIHTLWHSKYYDRLRLTSDLLLDGLNLNHN